MGMPVVREIASSHRRSMGSSQRRTPAGSADGLRLLSPRRAWRRPPESRHTAPHNPRNNHGHQRGHHQEPLRRFRQRRRAHGARAVRSTDRVERSRGRPLRGPEPLPGTDGRGRGSLRPDHRRGGSVRGPSLEVHRWRRHRGRRGAIQGPGQIDGDDDRRAVRARLHVARRQDRAVPAVHRHRAVDEGARRLAVRPRSSLPVPSRSSV